MTEEEAKTNGCVRICKDCRYFRRFLLAPWQDDLAKCKRPVNSRDDISPVNGFRKRRYSFCDTERGSTDDCGPSARYWRPQ